MLQSQSNTLNTKTTPLKAIAAVGKGFHPWKESPKSSSSPSEGHTPGQNLLQQQSSSNSLSQLYHDKQLKQQASSPASITSLASTTTSAGQEDAASSSYGSGFYYPISTPTEAVIASESVFSKVDPKILVL